jgi:hypothetical protein
MTRLSVNGKLKQLILHQKLKLPIQNAETIVASCLEVKQPKKRLAHQCSECPKQYMNKRSLKTHLLQKHDIGQAESTLMVGETIAELLLEVVQQAKAESGAKQPARWSCKLCDKSFSKKQSLAAHKSRIHGDGQHRCLVCDETFSQVSSLKRHMKAHKAEKHFMKQQQGISRASELRRMHQIVDRFNAEIAGLSDMDKKKVFKAMVRENPEVLETYAQDPFDETDITDMVRDVNLADAQLLKILTIIRRKFGNDKITPHVRALLRDKKELMSHLFHKEWLDKDAAIHFQGKDNEPVSR